MLELAHPLTGSQRLNRQAQAGLVRQALGFSAAKLGEVFVGFAKSWDEECDAQDFFCSAPAFSELLLLLRRLCLCG